MPQLVSCYAGHYKSRSSFDTLVSFHPRLSETCSTIIVFNVTLIKSNFNDWVRYYVHFIVFCVWILLSRLDAISKRICTPDLVSVKSFGSFLI